jgi:hypothetical protein
LLDAIVDGALDRTPVGIGCGGQTPPRCAKLGDLPLQPVDSLTGALAGACVRQSSPHPGESPIDWFSPETPTILRAEQLRD